MMDCYNEDQEEFVHVVRDLIDAQWGMACLNAAAGTGKTFFIKKFIKDHERLHIQVLAPTNKAANLLRSAGVPCSTIHKYFKAERQFTKEGEVCFYFPGEKQYIEDLIIVDECSMVSEAMFEVFDRASEHAPVLFCGDPYQIPPVDEPQSLCFKIENSYTFTENMRSRDSLSVEILHKFRNAVHEKKGAQIQDRLRGNDRDLIFSSFDKVGSDCIILAWTNKKVRYWNGLIRRYLFGNNDDDVKLNKFYIGEKLIFSGFREVNHRKYYSSDIVEVETLVEEALNVYYPFCNHQKSHKKIKKCLKCGIYKGHTELFKPLKFYKFKDQHKIEWLSVHEKDKAKLLSILLEHKAVAKLVNTKKGWIDYYNRVQIYNPDLKYSYSLTIHKAQGSEYRLVFVDIDNIRLCKKFIDSLKLSYTAVSRMIEYVHFI